ncbi:hypothetical protein CMK19_06320 [Candidatus Poribacteria bacterium]|jgi:cytochrome c-type biogenesis protein CcmH/NrfF|nr:hypothetical protein [Candidatus Poribacteria bacterium]MEE2909100.1 cytochrome c-type biogenesis protein CcmH [Candidatus Poribacteria bacterium]|tara:strand:- start:2726 stop:3223 length:498 start_codon:yes stop_codon:yes gene_type:complete
MLKQLSIRTVWFYYLTVVLTSGVVITPKIVIGQSSSDLKQLLRSVYCYCGCSRETIEVCVCGVAHDIKSEFKQLLSQGQTVEEIKAGYLAKYGTQFDAIMKAEGFNLVAYIAPFFFLLIFGSVAVLVIQRQKSEITAPPESGEKILDDNQLKKMEEQVEEYRQKR